MASSILKPRSGKGEKTWTLTQTMIAAGKKSTRPTAATRTTIEHFTVLIPSIRQAGRCKLPIVPFPFFWGRGRGGAPSVRGPRRGIPDPAGPGGLPGKPGSVNREP